MDIKEKSAYELESQVGHLLRLANQRHTTLFNEVVSMDLTPTQFAALIKLGELGKCSQNELGRRTAMDVATIKGVIERLRKKGLVEVNPDLNDRRRTIISICKDKTDIVPQLRKDGKEVSKVTLSPISASEQKTLLRLLKKLT
ncbi:MarR family transcriptional regulator [Aliiroseovarius sediminis]|uniref:MarR family winged helix-turn-helix transcriptional regulator n=1 Tax=Aliiroseovarius sediminis TaxID=2925839 RepID=UPI001F5A781B|nr:MarR family transcriptional regulator [Aliiroseovarius sediminis]MCI2394845.1 MarR family transcriptional regulator [Aliiroseovarius sediminis]